MKKIYCFLVLLILFLIVSCSNDDYQKPPINSVINTSIWPLENFNSWVFTKDTINDTIKIDSSYYESANKYFKTSGLNKFFIPDTTLNGPNSIFILDSIYFVNIADYTVGNNLDSVSYSQYNIPIIDEKMDVGETLTTSTTFNQSTSTTSTTITVISSSHVVEKNGLEAVAGKVFTEVVKVKNIYTYQSDSYNQTLNREIWFQPGIGPVKIINENLDTSYLILSYQLSESITTP